MKKTMQPVEVKIYHLHAHDTIVTTSLNDAAATTSFDAGDGGNGLAPTRWGDDGE